MSCDSGRCFESPGSGARSQKGWCVLWASQGPGSPPPARQESRSSCPLQVCRGQPDQFSRAIWESILKYFFLKSIYLFVSVLGFVAEQTFSSCGEWGCSPVKVPGLLIVVASLAGTQTLDAQASVFAARSIVVAARRLQSAGFMAVAHGIRAPWQVGSSPVRDRPHVPCVGRWIPIHCTTREVPPALFFLFFFKINSL